MTPFEMAVYRFFVIAHKLKGSQARLLLYLAHLAMKTGCLEVEATERAIMAATGLGHSQVQHGLPALEMAGAIAFIRGRRGVSNRFRVTALSGADLSLQQAQAEPTTGAGLRPFQAQAEPTTGAGLRPFQAQAEPTTGAGLRPFQAQAEPTTGAGEPVSGAGLRPFQAQQRGMDQDYGDGPARVDRSIEVVSKLSAVNSIDRILSTHEIPIGRRQEADALRLHLTAFVEAFGTPSLRERRVDDRLLAQCLAIGPIEALLTTLQHLKAAGPRDIGTFGYFVTAFIDRVLGFSPALVKERRAAIREGRKPPGSEHPDTAFTNEILTQASRGVKGMR